MEYILLACAVIIVICIIIMIRDINRFVVKRYELESDKISKDICFVVVSDLHNKSFGKDNYKLINAIDNLNPDYVLITGDILTGNRLVSYKPALEFIRRLSRKHKVIYGLGNHERRSEEFLDHDSNRYETYISKVREAGATVLVNDRYFLEDYNIYVYGIEIELKYYSKFRKKKMPSDYITSLLNTCDPDQYNIMLAHNPDYFEEYASWNPDLVLSGHVHGGIARLPLLGGVISPSYRLFPKYDGGLFKEKSSTMILSRGLGTHTLPVRFLNPGELPVVYIKKGKEL